MPINQSRDSEESNEVDSTSKSESMDIALLIIDAQEKLITSIENKELILGNINKLIESSLILRVHQYFTEQNPEKLGSTTQSITKDKQIKSYSKMSFSCIECKGLIRDIKTKNIKNLVLCGIETHICVQQTAIDLKNRGINIFVPIDAVGSRYSIDHETAIRRLQYAGVIITSTESIIFEWCKSADREEFKSISNIVKNRKY